MSKLGRLDVLALVALSGCMGGGGAQMPAVASSGAAAPMAAPQTERPGLGTSWGEQVYSPLGHTSFDRASDAPWATVVMHYDDAAGVAAHAAYLGSRPEPLQVPAGDGGLMVGLIDERGQLLPGYAAAGRTLVIGEDGARYKIAIHNGTSARFEVVASVDGLDVIDGKPADPSRRGYIVDPHDDLVIDGFRTSDRDVAAFRFGKVADSYAAQTSGDQNVGVIGLAVFAERGWQPARPYDPAEVERRDNADPFPGREYAQPPR
jgi:hypothetical protein